MTLKNVKGERNEKVQKESKEKESDILGAANAGIDQIFLNRKSEKKLSFHPTFEVEKLCEIGKIL